MKKQFLTFIFLSFYGLTAFAADDYHNLTPFPKWTHVLEAQKLPRPKFRPVTFEQIEKLNARDNKAIKYRGGHEGDNWQAPKESLKRGYGNCADYAVLKYYDLVKLGIHPGDMLIVTECPLGKDCLGVDKNELHAVLQVNMDDKLYILDSKKDAISEARGHYHNNNVLYGINYERWTRKPMEKDNE